MIIIIGYITLLFSIIGLYLNVKKRPACFVWWGFANLGWIFINLEKKIYSQAIWFVICFAFAVWGWIRWKKDDKGGEKK